MSPSNTVTCDIKVLILLYTPEKKAFLGFVPNNQVGFVDRLRKVIQQKQGIRQVTFFAHLPPHWSIVVFPQNPQGQLTGQPNQPIPSGGPGPGSSNNQVKFNLTMQTADTLTSKCLQSQLDKTRTGNTVRSIQKL